MLQKKSEPIFLVPPSFNLQRKYISAIYNLFSLFILLFKFFFNLSLNLDTIFFFSWIYPDDLILYSIESIIYIYYNIYVCVWEVKIG